MIREGSIRWNAAAEIISTIRPSKRKREKERETRNDARAAKRVRERERRDAAERKNSLGGEKRWKKRAEKKPSSHRANEPIFSHLARPDGWTDGRSGKKRREKGEKREVGEEAAMNFALPEEGAKEERGGAREETTHGGKK